MEAYFEIEMLIQVPVQNVVDTFITAFEGGSSSVWIKSLHYEIAEEDKEIAEHFKEKYGSTTPGILWLLPNTKAYIACHDEKGKEHILPNSLYTTRLKTFAEKHPSLMFKLATDHVDAWEADSFLQVWLFGSVIYG